MTANQILRYARELAVAVLDAGIAQPSIRKKAERFLERLDWFVEDEEERREIKQQARRSRR
jgi:hypothetical protein